MAPAKLVVWKEEYSVGSAFIDDEHRRIVDILNDLFNVIRDGKADAALREILARLADYTVTHFRDEEELMARCNYPGLDAQKKAHDFMRARTRQMAFAGSLGEGDARRLMEAVKEWWMGHILEMDRQCRPYFVARRPDQRSPVPT